MTVVNEDAAAARESMAEFMAAWAAADGNADGRLSRSEFNGFSVQHLSNVKARLGWAPDLTEEDSGRIWDAIHALNPVDAGIDLAGAPAAPSSEGHDERPPGPASNKEGH